MGIFEFVIFCGIIVKRSDSQGGVQMRVMTFNIQHCHDWQNNKIDIPLFADAIHRFGADICGLNEVRGKGPIPGYTDQLGEIAERLEYERYFGQTIKVGGLGPYGNGLISRYPITSAEVIHIPDTDDRSEKSNYEHRGFIRSAVDIDGREVSVIVCHMGLSVAEQRNAVEILCPIIDSTESPLILMGDFNTTPDSGVLDPVFERLSDTNDVSVNPDAYTFPSYAPEKKIDYLLYRGLACTRAETGTEVISDHYPIIADFDINE